MIVSGEYKFNGGHGCLLCPQCRTMVTRTHPVGGVKYACPTCPDTWVSYVPDEWRTAEVSIP